MLRVDVLDLAQPDRDRCHQQDGGDVVEEGGEDAGEDAQRVEQWPRATFRQAKGDHGHVIEEAGFAQNRHQHHHAEQEAQGFDVQPRDHLLQRGTLKAK